MQFSKMFKASSKSGRSVIASLVMVAVAATVLSFVPTHGAANTLAETCANPPSTPTLNYWPVTYNDENTPLCHDFPAIDAALDTSNPQFSQSETDWQDGLTMTNGQEGVALMYIHNGAANNLDPAQTTARDVTITTRTQTEAGSTHRIDVTFAGSNTNTVNKSFTVHTPANSKLEVFPNSGFMYDYEGHVILDQQNLNLGNSTYTLGDLDACFEFSLFLSFKFKVVTPANEDTTLLIDKKVKNITDNTDYANSVNADEGDRVGYQIKVKNNGPAVARAVTVTDNGVSGVSVDSGSTVISSNAALHQGFIPGTINLGDMQPGQEITITYTGRVTEDDCTTLTNTARAQASNAPQVSDTAAVVVRCDTPSHLNLNIKKWVKNDSTNTAYDDNQVNARTGERVKFKVSVTNPGDTALQNVRMTDRIPNGLQFDDSVTGDGTPSFNNTTFSVDFGSLSRGQTKTVEFAAKVLSTDTSSAICNIAKATATDVREVQDSACVKIFTTPKPGTPNIVLSKRAFNDTKNVDATTVNAARGDYITYSLVTTNTGTATQNNYVIRDDLSQVLPLADMVSTNGGTVSGNVISYPAVNIKPGETIVKTFKVRVKQTLDKNLSYQLRNTYGNTIVINVPGEVIYHAPTTGAAANSAGAFAGLVTAGFVAFRKRDLLMKLIFA
jgi:uncharacterized repeat protein (TIGR01451 family)